MSADQPEVADASTQPGSDSQGQVAAARGRGFVAGSDSPRRAAATRERDFGEGPDSLRRTTATEEQDFAEGSDSLRQAAAEKETDFGKDSGWKGQVAVAKEQDFAEGPDLPDQTRTSTDYSTLNECDIIRGQDGEISGAKLVRVRFRCPSAKCGNHKWKRNVPESWYLEGTVVCDHCTAVVPKSCVRSVETFIDVV